MADERIIELETATEVLEDDYLAIDSVSGETRKIKPIKIGATYEIEDGDHEFTLVGSNGYEHTVAIPYDSVSMTQAEYDALTPAQKADGTARFITDAISTEESELWSRVGRGTLHTNAQVISNAVNELKDVVGSGDLDTTSQELIGAVNEINSNSIDYIHLGYFDGTIQRYGRLRIISIYNANGLQTATSVQLTSKDYPTVDVSVFNWLLVTENPQSYGSRKLSLSTAGVLSTDNSVVRGGWVMVYIAKN